MISTTKATDGTTIMMTVCDVLNPFPPIKTINLFWLEHYGCKILVN